MKYVYLDTDYGRDLTANISENFKYWEFISIKAIRKGATMINKAIKWTIFLI